MMIDDLVVGPEEIISPDIDLAGAVALAEKMYGIKVFSATQLNGYDDRNYHLKVLEPPKNKFMPQLWSDGYVLKIMNSSDSKKLDFVEAQCEMILHLDKHGIRTPQPQKNINGHLYSIEKLQPNERSRADSSGKEHVMRLLTYQEGTLLKDVPGSLDLYRKVGMYTAQLNNILKDFHNSAYGSYSSLWMLRNVSKVREFLPAVRDEQRKTLVQEVIQEFENSVLTQLQSMEAGMIHGDINEQNVLCGKIGEEWKVTGILDLGDSHHSAYLFELALACAYMMMLSGNLESGRSVVRGYCSVLPLPRHHLVLLKVCICARLCQSLVLGLHTASQHPDNVYVLSSQSAGWEILQNTWEVDPYDILPPEIQ